ncbi:hypothetical protein [uncultured Dietzia sp.]|jgi:hypothetical protein|uniref:hypothetical protein n=1 Tax=uncultured Dietzia sp. TaxID=395519 RepID=UPI00262C3980|nr:hypothetical protein [uncultured Dietzia sp.]HMT49242.1 hypothetical protein [Dietzia sp.]
MDISLQNRPPGPLTAAELAVAVPDPRARRTYRRIWHGVYRRQDQVDDLRLRSLALAKTWPEGVLRGRSAALLWGDDSVAADALPEIWLPSTRRSPQGRVYRYGALPAAAVTDLGGLRVTTPLRTCRDLAADLDFEDAVVAVERLCAAVPELAGQLASAVVHPAGRGGRMFGEVVRAADPLSRSSDSTRARLALAAAGCGDFGHGHTVRLAHRTLELPLADPVARCVVSTAGGTAPACGAIPEWYRAQLLAAGWTVIVVRGPAAPVPRGTPVPPGVGDVGHRAAAVLWTRWPSSEIRVPPRDAPAADPHGMWAGRRG